MNIKRPAPHSIEGFENSNMKKIHSIGQINSNSSFLMPNSSLNKIFGTKVEN